MLGLTETTKDGGGRHNRGMDTAQAYEVFARVEAAGSSPTYERLALQVAATDELLDRLDGLPPGKRQPNLMLASARVAGAPLAAPGEFVEFVLSEWDRIAEIMLTHSTQTNEPARCATLLAVLASVTEDVALVEVGCSAGLCLYPDRYRISYDDRSPLVVDSNVTIDVTTTGSVPIAQQLPNVVARIGLDLHPLDVSDAADRAWLEALIWPEHTQRLVRLRAAASVVAADPPALVTGDLVDHLDAALALVPAGARPVVFHSAVLSYLPETRRVEFVEQLRQRPQIMWMSNEAPGVVADVETSLRPPPDATAAAFFIVAVNGASVGICDPHGTWIRWPGLTSRPR